MRHPGNAEPARQAKCVRCVRGAVLDVIVDVRGRITHL
ncbi:dTDP-4-dehydrorhamnose 3,5-epimerase family protein [Streptomyces sp. NPDC051362]